MSWTPPSEFEEYRIVRVLGAGAMGQVFLAHDTLLDRAVAIKFIAALDINASARERFFTEARAVARLSHPNVVGIHRVGEIRQRPYLVSEYARGTPLSAIAKPIAWERTLKIGIGLARGLASAHRRGVLHRDIKPANVMLGDDDEAKLLDFGLAKLVSVASEARPEAMARGTQPIGLRATAATDATTSLAGVVHDATRPPAHAPDGHGTVDGAIVGTPLYLAPELWRGAPASRRSDVYSLGIVLYELAAGQAPHAAVPIAELATCGAAAPIATLAGELPARFADLIDACVHPDPAQRPESADVLCELLEAMGRRGEPSIDGSPYRGLGTFESEHRGVFFGRAEETRAVAERLRTETFVVVAGDSGAGKSSLCRAAVLPAVLEKSLAGRRWRSATMIPGARPLARLDEALATRSPDEGLLLFVDQLEELLTVADPDEANAVAERLAELVVTGSTVRVLASARSDFLGRLAALPWLGELVGRALFLLGPLSDRGLRDAIVGPAHALGYELESPAIIDELVASGRRNLPLLQFTLAELWDARDDKTRTIPADALAKIGGVAGALARRADQVMAALGDADREIAWRVLVRLMTAEGTRAVMARAELAEVAGDPIAVERVVERLVAARLLTVAIGGDDRVEVVHEALFTGWPRLVEWRRTHEADARMRDQLAEAARQWRERDEPRGLLWRDDALVEYRLWAKRWREPLATIEVRFGAASEAEARRVRRRRVAAVAFVIAGLSLALALLYRSDLRALAEREEAERQNRSLLVLQGHQELEAGYAGRALAYFVDALARGEDSPALRFAIAQAGWAASRDRGAIVREPRGHWKLATSPDRTLLASVERGGMLRVFDEARTLVFSEDTRQDVLAFPTFTPDGRRLVAIGSRLELYRWDVPGWRADPVAMGAGREVPPIDLAMSPDGTRIAVAYVDDVVRVWDLATGRLERVIGEPRVPPGILSCLGFSPDGTRLVTGTLRGDITVRPVLGDSERPERAGRGTRPSTSEWITRGEPGTCRVVGHGARTYVASGTKVFAWDSLDARPATVFTGHSGAIQALEVRSDGDELVTTSVDGTAKRWNARTGELLGELSPWPRRALGPIHYDSSGRRVVFTSGALFRVWDLAPPREVMVIEPALEAGTSRAAPAGAFEAVFSRDGSRIIAASGVDVHEWTIGSEPLIAELAQGREETLIARFSPDDRALAIAGGSPAELRGIDGTLRVRIALPARAWDASWSRDGRHVLFVGHEGMARIFDREGRPVAVLAGHEGTVNHAAFAPDAMRVVTACDDGTARIWEAGGGRELLRLPHPGRVLSAVWSSNGLRIATAGYDGWIRIWDATTGAKLAELGDPRTQFLDLAFSPDNTRIAAAGHDNVVTLWDVASRTRVRTFVGHLGPVTGVAWSPDGILLASSSDDGAVRVWDCDTARSIAQFQPVTGGTMSVEWSHDGTRLVSAGGKTSLWDVRRDTRTLAELRAFMVDRVSWNVVDGKLVDASPR